MAPSSVYAPLPSLSWCSNENWIRAAFSTSGAKSQQADPID